MIKSEPQIIFQNEYFLVIEKPPNWLSVPSRMGRADPRPVAGIWLQESIGRRVWPVHRLDAEVSGVLMFAIQEAAHAGANRAFEQHEIRKKYEAWSDVTHDLPPHSSWMEWKIMLAKGKKRAYIADFGKECITRAHCAGIVQRLGKEWSRWLLKPLTGRPHQLRFEMARHGYPIAGDQLYGSSSLWLDGKHGIALRATELDFTQWDQAIDFGLPSRVGVSELGLNDGTK